MNLINILNSNKFDELPRSEVMLILADQLEGCGDVLTVEALRWAEERGRWVAPEGQMFVWDTYECATIIYQQELRAQETLYDHQEHFNDIFSAFQQLGIWLDEGFVIRDFDGYPAIQYGWRLSQAVS